MNIREIELSKVFVSNNSRKEIDDTEIASLVMSIKNHGLLQPIGVTMVKSGGYKVIYGHRRLHACKKLGNKTIDAFVFEDQKEEDTMILNITENIHRKDVNAYEKGRYFYVLMNDFKLSLSELEARVSVHAGIIKKYIKIFERTPAQFRSKVVNKSGSPKRKGNIPLGLASDIITMRKNYGLTKKQMELLFTMSKSSDEFTAYSIKIIGQLISQGVPFTQAVKKHKDYIIIRPYIVTEKKFIDKIKEKEGNFARWFSKKIYEKKIVPDINK